MNDRVVYRWGDRLLSKTASAIAPMIGDVVFLAIEDTYEAAQYPFRVVKRHLYPSGTGRGEYGNGTTVFIEVIRMEDDDE